MTNHIMVREKKNLCSEGYCICGNVLATFIFTLSCTLNSKHRNTTLLHAGKSNEAQNRIYISRGQNLTNLQKFTLFNKFNNKI